MHQLVILKTDKLELIKHYPASPLGIVFQDSQIADKRTFFVEEFQVINAKGITEPSSPCIAPRNGIMACVWRYTEKDTAPPKRTQN